MSPTDGPAPAEPECPPAPDPDTPSPRRLLDRFAEVVRDAHAAAVPF